MIGMDDSNVAFFMDKMGTEGKQKITGSASTSGGKVGLFVQATLTPDDLMLLIGLSGNLQVSSSFGIQLLSCLLY